MDEVLRRRLVGAAVLLGAAFLLASLLPNPVRRDATRHGQVVTYDLRTGQPLDAPPSAAIGQTVPPEKAAAPSAPAPAVAPLPRPTLKVDESLSGAGWHIQIGSFENQANARNVLQKLYGAGMPTTIQSISAGKKLWYRVRVGPYRDEAAAQQALASIRQQGYPLAKLVRPEAPGGGGN